MKATLQNARDKIDDYHGHWFRTVEEMCDAVNLEPSTPRLCVRQKHRSNIPAEVPSAYYRRNISIPFLDHLLSEMEIRFSSHQQTALLGMAIVPSVLVDLSMDECTVKFAQVVATYEEDFPSPECFHSELHCWWMRWQQHCSEHGQSSLPTTVAQSLQQVSSMYPNIRALLSILCTLPVTSCSAERSFSGLKRIKTALRSSMGTERLTSLNLLHLHRDIEVDIQAAIDEFARRHPRRLKMANILED